MQERLEGGVTRVAPGRTVLYYYCATVDSRELPLVIDMQTLNDIFIITVLLLEECGIQFVGNEKLSFSIYLGRCRRFFVLNSYALCGPGVTTNLANVI